MLKKKKTWLAFGAVLLVLLGTAFFVIDSSQLMGSFRVRNFSNSNVSTVSNVNNVNNVSNVSKTVTVSSPNGGQSFIDDSTEGEQIGEFNLDFSSVIQPMTTDDLRGEGELLNHLQKVKFNVALLDGVGNAVDFDTMFDEEKLSIKLDGQLISGLDSRIQTGQTGRNEWVITIQSFSSVEELLNSDGEVTLYSDGPLMSFSSNNELHLTSVYTLFGRNNVDGEESLWTYEDEDVNNVIDLDEAGSDGLYLGYQISGEPGAFVQLSETGTDSVDDGYEILGAWEVQWSEGVDACDSVAFNIAGNDLSTFLTDTRLYLHQGTVDLETQVADNDYLSASNSTLSEYNLSGQDLSGELYYLQLHGVIDPSVDLLAYLSDELALSGLSACLDGVQFSWNAVRSGAYDDYFEVNYSSSSSSHGLPGGIRVDQW